MSFEATKWAWAQIRAGSLPFRARHVLLTLTDRHNDDYNRCNPGIACICNDTGMYRETVMDMIKLLEAENLIVVSRKLGTGSSYKFVGFNHKNQSAITDRSENADQSLNTDHLPPENRSSDTDQSANTDSDQSAITDSNQSVNTDTNQEIEPLNKTYKRKREKATSAPSAFSIFYDAYPKKKGREKAEKAWAKINPSDELIEEIMSALNQAKKSRDWLKDSGQFIPYPATWLNGQRWEDEINPAPSVPDACESASSGFLGIQGLI